MTKDEIRELCENDLQAFARLVQPTRVYGQVHDDVFAWLTAPKAKDHQLVLLPRAHQKSHLIAVWCAWWITKHPETTILYVSATEDLATGQLYAIKSILESDIYRRYWPEMIHEDEMKREEWSAKNIKVDHPARKLHGVRDRTVAARSIKSNTTGLHCDVLVFDDIVVPNNAYTELGREEVAKGFSQFSSIKNPGSITKVVGTRYHPRDIYDAMITMKVETFDEQGAITGETMVFEMMEGKVVDEDGNFLWPRELHPKTGKWFGFNQQVLAKIRAQYISVGQRVQYYAQYFNEPNDPESQRVDHSTFQYFEREHLDNVNGTWYYAGKQLAVFAAADLAYTTGESSDYSAFAVVGVDTDGYYYILDLYQMKTDKYERFYETVEQLWDKWGFRKMRIESNAGANIIVQYIKDRIRQEGRTIVVEGKPSSNAKVERTAAILEPRYENNSVWHFRGGFMSVYEEQLILARPAHDDLKDAVTAAVEISHVPVARRKSDSRGSKIVSHPRFGGRVA